MSPLTIVVARYTLIHNLNYWAPFPIDQDGYLAPTFQDILNRTRTRAPLPWRITLKEYYYRSNNVTRPIVLIFPSPQA